MSDDPFGCNSRVQTSVFVHTFILGASCIPTGLILPLFVNYLGYKFFLGKQTNIFFFLPLRDIYIFISKYIFISNTSIAIKIQLFIPEFFAFLFSSRMSIDRYRIILSVISVITAFIPAVVTACLFLVETSTQNLVLSCAYESVTSVCLSVVYCLLVDLYPTHLR